MHLPTALNLDSMTDFSNAIRECSMIVVLPV
jgi:hypothetical protein